MRAVEADEVEPGIIPLVLGMVISVLSALDMYRIEHCCRCTRALVSHFLHSPSAYAKKLTRVLP